MKTVFITFRSITPAQRGQKLLQKAGLEVVLQRTPRWMEEQGCGYCLRLRLLVAQQACQKLREERIPFSKVYLGEEGGVRELHL